MGYKVVTVSLAAVIADPPLTVVQPGTRIGEVSILDVPAGGSFKMRVGDGNDFFTVVRPFSMEPVGDEFANRGLYIRNPVAQPGVSVELLIVYGDNRSGINPNVS